MGERRFLIHPFPNDYNKWNVTEDELKARLDLAFRVGFAALTEEMDWDKVIDILINGEAKEPEKPKETYDDWVNRMPLYKDYDSESRREDALKAWFREMPRK